MARYRVSQETERERGGRKKEAEAVYTCVSESRALVCMRGGGEGRYASVYFCAEHP